MDKNDLDKTWIRYKKTGNVRTRNKLIEHYLSFVDKIAKKLAKRLEYHVSAEDLASLGLDGLYDAIDKFDIHLGVKFESYANRRIRGSMIDWLRKQDVVPRSVRLNNDKFDTQKSIMQSEELRKVTDEEVAVALNVDGEFAKKHKKFRPVMFNSLESMCLHGEEIKEEFNTNLIDHDCKSPDAKLKRIEFFSKLMGDSFNKTERVIIYLYYYKEFTMNRVSRYVGLSESRVSQMHKNILPRLRDKISRNPDFFGDDIYKYISSLAGKELLFD